MKKIVKQHPICTPKLSVLVFSVLNYTSYCELNAPTLSAL